MLCNKSAAILKVKRNEDVSDDSTLDLCEGADAALLKEAKYQIIFAHPEACLSCKEDAAK